MRPRKNTRSKSRIMVTNTPDKIADIVKIKVEGKSSYRCMICGNIYPRRFNAERHYKRFHEITQARKCCDEIFYTKSDYYDHKRNMHNESKRYGRGWKERTQSSDSSTECNIAINKHGDCTLDVTSKTSISVKIVKERISEKCADTNSAHHAQDNVKDAESNNKEKSKNNIWHPRQSVKSPKKIFIYRMQQETNRSQNSAPLRSIENFTEKSLNKKSRKHAFQNVVKVSSNAKENVIIYDCTATSVPDLMRLMRNTIDF